MAKPLPQTQASGIAASLSQCSLFSSLTMDQLMKIAAISKIVTFQKGETITTAGSHLDETYVVQSGLVRFSTQATSEKQKLTGLVKPGMCFGLMSVIHHENAIVSCEALSQVKLIHIPSEPFLELYKEIPELPINVSATLAEHLRHLITIAQLQKGRSIEARLARWILEQPAPRPEEDEEPEISEDGKPCIGVITMDITKTALARELGVTQQTLSRALLHLRKRDLVTSKGKHLYLFDRAGIEACADESEENMALV